VGFVVGLIVGFGAASVFWDGDVDFFGVAVIPGVNMMASLGVCNILGAGVALGVVASVAAEVVFAAVPGVCVMAVLAGAEQAVSKKANTAIKASAFIFTSQFMLNNLKQYVLPPFVR
jgi:hypothetical protein